jgi:hypothetical protein
MKLIDCESPDLAIEEYFPGDKYIALSYVWGKPSSNETSESAPAGTEAPQNQGMMKPQSKQLLMDSRNCLNKLGLNPSTKNKLLLSRHSSVAVKGTHHSTAASRRPNLRLPEQLPLTIRDAIWVTKSLGYRFLWVDQYCIDQTNDDEKQQQFSRMGDIYAGAEITIFALGNDSNYGLPGVSARQRISPRQHTTIGEYKFLTTMQDPHVCIKESAWSTRGWTYQEALFSTRRLFFTDFQTYFECNAMNMVESFSSDPRILHVLNGQRLRAYHRAGKYVCGNSNPYSHLNVGQNQANHRKVDTIRRCQYQIRQYTKRELTNQSDILNAFAGVARFYAKTSAKIASVAGIPIPYPIAKLPNIEREGLDHLIYALAWTHRVNNHTGGFKPAKPIYQTRYRARRQEGWSPFGNPGPQRREGFPSWSWAGWFGEIEEREDLPYCWTSQLGRVVKIGFRGGREEEENYTQLQRFARYKQYFIRRLLAADTLTFDAYVIDPEKLKRWERYNRVNLNLSVDLCSWTELHGKLEAGTMECVLLGTYGEPRADVFRAIQRADKKRRDAKLRRIDMFARREPDAIVCLLVHTVNGISERRGLLRIEGGAGRERLWDAWVSGPMRSFVLK